MTTKSQSKKMQDSVSRMACVFCDKSINLDTIPKEAKNNEDILNNFLEILSKYLNRGCKKINLDLDMGALRGRKACEDCTSQVKIFCEKFPELELLDMKIAWTLESLNNKMALTLKAPLKLRRSLRSGPTIGVDENVLELKKRLVEKCSQKLSSIGPHVQVTELKEVAKIPEERETLEPTMPTLSPIDEEEGRIEEVLELMPLEVESSPISDPGPSPSEAITITSTECINDNTGAPYEDQNVDEGELSDTGNYEIETVSEALVDFQEVEEEEIEVFVEAEEDVVTEELDVNRFDFDCSYVNEDVEMELLEDPLVSHPEVEDNDYDSNDFYFQEATVSTQITEPEVITLDSSPCPSPAKLIRLAPSCPNTSVEAGSSQTKTTTSPHHKLYTCDICRKNVASLRNLELHRRSHLGEKPYECAKCKMMFNDTSNLRRHCLRYHRILLFPQFKENAMSARTFKIMLDSLVRALSQSVPWSARQNKRSRHSCKLCEKQYSMSTSTEEHIVQNHYSVLAHFMVNLGRDILQHSKESLVDLMKAVYQNQDVLVPCGVCNNIFSQTKLNEHIKDHIGVAKTTDTRKMLEDEIPVLVRFRIKCTGCDKYFRAIDRFRSHKRKYQDGSCELNKKSVGDPTPSTNYDLSN